VIRSWPKVIFLYPVMLASFICGGIQAGTGGLDVSGYTEIVGFVFFATLCLNFLVITFEFSRFRMVAVFAVGLAVAFLLLYLGDHYEVFPFLRETLAKLHLKASSSFYFAIGIFSLAIFGGVFVTTRFDYWIINSNEILHKEGFLGDTRRFPSPNLKMTKEIADVFEFLLLGAGRVVLFPASEKQAVVLNHVLGVNRVELRVQELLSALTVEVTEGGGRRRRRPADEDDEYEDEYEYE